MARGGAEKSLRRERESEIRGSYSCPTNLLFCEYMSVVYVSKLPPDQQ